MQVKGRKTQVKCRRCTKAQDAGTGTQNAGNQMQDAAIKARDAAIRAQDADNRRRMRVFRCGTQITRRMSKCLNLKHLYPFAELNAALQSVIVFTFSSGFEVQLGKCQT